MMMMMMMMTVVGMKKRTMPCPNERGDSRRLMSSGGQEAGEGRCAAIGFSVRGIILRVYMLEFVVWFFELKFEGLSCGV